ncbi:MAG: hypothetical protein ACFE9R_04250 [Candidatus Hermodarchaeota archaeon]
MEVKVIKKIHFEISLPIKGLQDGKKYDITLRDNGTFLEALALVDKKEMESPEGSIFPINEGYIHNYMQLLVNFEENTIYEDVGISAYGPNQEGNLNRFNPIRDDLEFNLYPDSIIQLQPDVGC